ncbi:hypothetical protein ABI59_16420 [Acidobacteria bacterium Mor1]|nr:hypothetical protein ABI59_16420 [Acidobacteria bacterium Mor1]
MDIQEQLHRAVRIQELALQTAADRKIIEEAPGRIEEIEARFRERNAEYVAVKERFEELDSDQKSRNNTLAELEEAKKKYQSDLMQVQNQREYAAILKEIDECKARISENEEAVLRAMDELESLKGDLDNRNEHIQQERDQVESERNTVEGEVKDAKARMSDAAEERSGLEDDLPSLMKAAIAKLEQSRQGIFLAKAEDGTCQVCYVRVRPQAYQEVKLAQSIHYCGSCKRILYHQRIVDDMAGVGHGKGGTA